MELIKAFIRKANAILNPDDPSLNDKSHKELADALMALRRHLLDTQAAVAEHQLDDLEQAEYALRTITLSHVRERNHDAQNLEAGAVANRSLPQDAGKPRAAAVVRDAPQDDDGGVLDVEALLDNAACASQVRELLRDDEGEETVLREAVRRAVVEPLLRLIPSSSGARSFPICKDHTNSDWNQPTLEDDNCVLCRLFYLEAQESLLEEWQQRAKRAEDAIAEIKRPLDEQMARLNATVALLNAENELLRSASGEKK